MRAMLIGLMMTAFAFPALAADAAAGNSVFHAKCAICHSTEQGTMRIGPSLFGVVGRPAGTLAGFSYSDAMKTFGKTWTPDELNTYLSDPHQVVQGTKMPFAGIDDANDRANLVAFLGTLK